MFGIIIGLICLALSPAVGSTARNVAWISTCRVSEFTCLDGTCISAVSVCDNNWDCPDGSDEAICYSSSASNLTEDTVYHGRFKRQSKCGLYEWRCADGTCIPADGECDGQIDCPDKSDETHALCRNKKCQSNWFRCTYGACVDGTAPCNNKTECADESDELLPRCRSDTRQDRGKFRCLDGNSINVDELCDGVPNCPDGSDETVRACADQSCATHLFQCAYGACVDEGADCNGTRECADGSDESAELCNKIPPTIDNRINSRPNVSGPCVLPEYPKHGTYTRGSNAQHATPGQGFPYVQLNITCKEGYGVIGESVVLCQDGNWRPPNIPQCVPFCKLDPHISIHYYCLLSGQYQGRRICKSSEPVGTIVKPVCNYPNYYDDNDLRGYMRCEDDGKWNRIFTCSPECGRLTPIGDSLVINGTAAKRGEIPWHIAIYRKPTEKINYYNLICGGSLVTNSIVISAAHCFWSKLGFKQDHTEFAVAAAKLYSDWNHPDDIDAQKSELRDIHMTPYFKGAATNFQNDIAILTLEKPFVYQTYLRPVCLSFIREFNDRQLQKGKPGKVAGFGFTQETVKQNSPILQVVDLPFIPVEECLRKVPAVFVEKITGDKICAGYNEGTAALCQGDSGGGLSFPETDGNFITRYYLRGIVSTAPQSAAIKACNRYTVITFTLIQNHEDFINRFI